MELFIMFINLLTGFLLGMTFYMKMLRSYSRYIYSFYLNGDRRNLFKYYKKCKRIKNTCNYYGISKEFVIDNNYEEIYKLKDTQFINWLSTFIFTRGVN